MNVRLHNVSLIFIIVKMISETVAQDHIHQPYTTKQGCLCNHCSAFTTQVECNRDKNGVKDFEWGSEMCCVTCPSAKKCGKLDENTCKLDDNGASFVSAQWDIKAPLVKCTVDSRKIHTADQLIAFRRKFGNTKSFHDLATKFCDRPSNKCMNGLTNCSKYTSTGKDGTFCRQFLGEMTNKEQDTQIIDHCINHKTSDCACILRSHDPEFLKMKQHTPINDNCWWKPCFDNTSYLVPHEVKRQMCPNNVCNSFIKTDRVGQNENVSDNIINCGKISVFNVPKRLIVFTYVGIVIVLALVIFRKAIRKNH